MYRFSITVSKPFVDAASAEEALKLALSSKVITFTQGEIPRKVQLLCSVTPAPNASGQYSARALLNNELIASVDAPSPERALAALGYGNPKAHNCHVFRRRFGDNYELVLATK